MKAGRGGVVTKGKDVGSKITKNVECRVAKVNSRKKKKPWSKIVVSGKSKAYDEGGGGSDQRE